MLEQFITFMLVGRKDDEKGATAVEYGLMVALIAVAIVGTVTILGTTLSGLFTTVTGSLQPGCGPPRTAAADWPPIAPAGGMSSAAAWHRSWWSRGSDGSA